MDVTGPETTIPRLQRVESETRILTSSLLSTGLPSGKISCFLLAMLFSNLDANRIGSSVRDRSIQVLDGRLGLLSLVVSASGKFNSSLMIRYREQTEENKKYLTKATPLGMPVILSLSRFICTMLP